VLHATIFTHVFELIQAVARKLVSDHNKGAPDSAECAFVEQRCEKTLVQFMNNKYVTAQEEALIFCCSNSYELALHVEQANSAVKWGESYRVIQRWDPNASDSRGPTATTRQGWSSLPF
jgi:hypothetical protein